MNLDPFGITMLHPTAGREWFSSWANGRRRYFDHRAWDPCDPEFEVRGLRPYTVEIDGAGVVRMAGEQPRLYVYDRDPAGRKWGNVEVTFYARRIAEDVTVADKQGFIAGARSEHQVGDDPCRAVAYYGRMMYDRKMNFKKELGHPYYSAPLPDDTAARWPEAELPCGRWIGYKFVVRGGAAGTPVRLALYRDLAEGAGGGAWEELAAAADAGDWPVPGTRARCAYPDTRVLAEPATAVFIRNSQATAEYRQFSIREIDAG